MLTNNGFTLLIAAEKKEEKENFGRGAIDIS